MFEITLGAQVTMTGFTISGGFTTDAGGGVLVANPSNLTLTGVRIRGGQARSAAASRCAARSWPRTA